MRGFGQFTMNPSLMMAALVALIVIVIVFVWAANGQRDQNPDRERPRDRRPRRRPTDDVPVEPPTQPEEVVRYSTGRTPVSFPWNLSRAIAVGYQGDRSSADYMELSPFASDAMFTTSGLGALDAEVDPDFPRVRSQEVTGFAYRPRRALERLRLGLSLRAPDSRVSMFRGQLYRRAAGDAYFVPVDEAYVTWAESTDSVVQPNVNVQAEVDLNVDVQAEVVVEVAVETTDELVLVLIYTPLLQLEPFAAQAPAPESFEVRLSGQLELEPDVSSN